MKGILINPFDETIKEVVVTNDYKDIYLLIDCSTFDVARLSEDGDLFIDDEGLLKNPTRYFSWSGRVFAGKGLVLSHNEDGDTMSATYDLQEVVDRVEFLPEGHVEQPYMEFKILS